MATINEAISAAATQKFWSFLTEGAPSEPPPDLTMNREEWLSLSPGYRRTIWRDFERIQKTVAPVAEPEPEPSLKARRQAVEYAGRKRL